MQLQPGTLLQGRYRVVRLIAQGGMGAVYEAVDERLGSTVALKQTLMADPRLRAAFEREARLLAGLHHPALPVVSDHFAEDGDQFLVMQFIPGDDLGTLLSRRGGPFALAEALPWADRLLDALDYLHTRTPPIIHRDVKPQNLKLTARGDLVLLDFGLAKGEPAGATSVNPSLFGYTPQYAPLEQIQGSGTDARSDLYAVAATLYELLTGAAGPDALTRAAAAVRGEPEPLRPAHELRPELPAAVSALLARALALNPALRPPSAAAMRNDLRAAGRAQALASVAAAPLPRVSSAGKTTVAAPAPAAVAVAAEVAPPVARPRRAVRKPPSWRPFIVIILLTIPLLALSVSLANNAPPSGGAVVGSTRPGGAGASRADPLPPGARVAIPGWDVEVTQVVRGGDANERMVRANQFNAKPPRGMEYALLYLRATSTASADQYAFNQADVGVVGSRDVAHRSSGVAPSPRLDSSEQIPPGASVEGWAPFLVGTEERDLVAILGDLLGGSARMISLSPGARLAPDPTAPAVTPNAVGADYREPAGLGETAITERWEITVEESLLGDAAWERIRANYNGSNPPPAGMRYAMLYVRARFLGDGDEPALIAAGHFVGMAGPDEVDQPVVLVPDPELFRVLFPGGSAEGWVVLTVPADDTARAAFRGAGISLGDRDGWRYFLVE